MSLDDFGENLNFILPSQAESFDEKAFKKFLDGQGPDFANGFFAAMKYVEPKVRKIYRTLDSGDGYNVDTRAKMRDKAMGLENHIEQILSFAPTLNILPGNDATKLPQHKPE